MCDARAMNERAPQRGEWDGQRQPTMTSDARGVPRQAAIAPAAIVEFLVATEVLGNIDRATIERVASHVFAADVPARTVIASAGARNPGIGVVFRGKVSVRRDGTS